MEVFIYEKLENHELTNHNSAASSTIKNKRKILLTVLQAKYNRII